MKDDVNIRGHSITRPVVASQTDLFVVASAAEKDLQDSKGAVFLQVQILSVDLLLRASHRQLDVVNPAATYVLEATKDCETKTLSARLG